MSVSLLTLRTTGKTSREIGNDRGMSTASVLLISALLSIVVAACQGNTSVPTPTLAVESAPIPSTTSAEPVEPEPTLTSEPSPPTADTVVIPSDSQQTAYEPTPQDLAPELVAVSGWINSEPLMLKDLRGKVVLVDFWTYTCINCIRTFPYLKAWNEQYSDHGLLILGVHTPEFEFEKLRENVIDAMETHGLEYPVVQDNSFATWRAFNNRYWPAVYLIDQNGYIRYKHFGEGAYDETERQIRALLTEAGYNLTSVPISTPSGPI